MEKIIRPNSNEKNIGESESQWTRNTVQEFVRNSTLEEVFAELPSIESEYHSIVVTTLVEKGEGIYVRDNLSRFKDLNSSVAIDLISHYCLLGLHNLDNFGDLNAATAIAFIEKGYETLVLKNLEKFKDFDLNFSVATTLIEKGQGLFVAFHLEEFKDVNYNTLATTLIEKGEGVSITRHLEMFEDIDFNSSVATALIEAGRGGYVVANLRLFKKVERSTLANELIEASGGLIVLNNLEKFKEVDYNTLATSLIEAGDGMQVVHNLEKFKGLDYRICKAGAKAKEYALLGLFLGTDWARRISDSEFEEVSKENEELARFTDELSVLYPQSSVFQRYVISSELLANEISNIDFIKEDPFIGTHLAINPRMAARLVVKWPEFDTISKINIEQLHLATEGVSFSEVKSSEIPNTILRDKLMELFPNMRTGEIPQAEEEIPQMEVAKIDEVSLDMLSYSYRTRAINALLNFENNPRILNGIQSSGIDGSDWLMYPKQEQFVIEADKELSLLEQSITTPLSRLTTESISTLSKNFKQAFIERIPQNLSLPNEFDDKYLELQKKLEKTQEALERESDPNKIKGIEKGILSITDAFRKYKSPGMREALHGALTSVTVLSKAINEFRTEQNELLAVSGPGTRDRIKQIKELDSSIAGKSLALITRIERLMELFEKVGEEMNLSYEIFETKELFEHIKEDSIKIREILSAAARNESSSLEGREMTIGICNRNPYSSLYLGNYTGCCISIEGEIHGGESPIADYLTDVGMQIVTVVDTTIKEKPLPVVAVWCYIGSDSADKPVLQIDNIEANTGYTDIHKEQFTQQVKHYMDAYASKLGLMLYQGPSYNDLVVAPIAKHKKLGGLYNREDGYYLEAEP